MEVAHEKCARGAMCIKMVTWPILGFAELKFLQSDLSNVNGVTNGKQLPNVIVGQKERHGLIISVRGYWS
jgi:hypothetical protein